MNFSLPFLFGAFNSATILNFGSGFLLQSFLLKSSKKVFPLQSGSRHADVHQLCVYNRLLKNSIFTNINYKLFPTFAIQKRIDMDAVAFIHEQLTAIPTLPNFKAGDNITVNYKIVEGVKERIQSFKGDVIKRQGVGSTATFTVRKISDGVGVERLFPAFSPNIESIVLNKVGRVRRAKLYFLRERSGKSARIKEKRMAVGLKKGKA